jgi:type II secretory pathway component PulF
LQERASFYQKLHTGIKSGLTLQQILDARLLSDGSADSQDKIKSELDKGSTIAKAFRQAGLITTWEAELINIGETSGRLESILARLDDYCSLKAVRFSQIKGRLVYPLLILVFAIVLLPLPALVAGSLTVIAYGMQVGISLLIIRLLFQSLLVKPFERAEIGAFNGWLIRSQRFVGDNNVLRLMFEISYMDLLALCLESGMDAVTSLKLMQRCLKNKKIQRQHALVISSISKSGASLSESLHQYDILKNNEVISFLVSSEQSGTLHSAMREFIVRKSQEVDATVGYLVGKLSSVIYLCVLIYAVMKIMPLLLSGPLSGNVL